MLNRDKIEKSLFNKTINSIDYNPKIVINNQNKTIKTRLIELIESSDRVDIAVSYVVWSGLQQLYEKLKSFDSRSRIILTTEGYVTDPKSLIKLNELDIQVKVYSPIENGSGFHLKTYLFEKQNLMTLFIGSANISSRAFGYVHEMAIEVDANKDGYIVKDYSDNFEILWNEKNSIYLDDVFIKNYSMQFDSNKEKLKMLHEFDKEKSLISPNVMQKDALEKIQENRDAKKGLIIAATGTGKTYLSAFDVKRFGSKKTLFLVHNRLILTSAIESYNNIFGNNSTLELTSSNLNEIHNFNFIFTTDKTAKKHLINQLEMNYFDYIIYDEAHKIGESTQYVEIMNYFKPKYSLGITATPERTKDPEFLFKTFDYNVPYEIRLLDSMNSGLICPFSYYGYNIPDKLLGLDERFNIDELIPFLLNLIDSKGHYGNKLKAIVFCRDKKEASEVNNGLNKLGRKSMVAISGEASASRDEIENSIKSLSSDDGNSLEFICVVNKFNEGIDIPEINTIIMLRNTSSSIIYTQQLGRGLRKTFDPEKFVTIYDLIGNSKNNYTIAQVLTGNETSDKRELLKRANNGFVSVSPFINVDIEKEAMLKIIKSISYNFKAKNELRLKFESELLRFREIPTLLELYKNPSFKELNMLQLLYKDFYTPFSKYYKIKYNTPMDDPFLKIFFKFITQFVFRGYNNSILTDYVNLLLGKPIKNEFLSRVIAFHDSKKGIATTIYSQYYAKGNNYPKVFELNNDLLTFNQKILDKLKERNSYELFIEHIDLFRFLSKEPSYQMKPFDLLDKSEFLYHTKSNNFYLNSVGEYIDEHQKKVFCPITISKVRKNYSNQILDDGTLIYCTQKKPTKVKSIEKDNQIINEKYDFHICARFPHLGYEKTQYYNLGSLTYISKSEPIEHPEGGFYHELTFKINNKIPKELLQYKDLI